jgi:hypothetical protein
MTQLIAIGGTQQKPAIRQSMGVIRKAKSTLVRGRASVAKRSGGYPRARNSATRVQYHIAEGTSNFSGGL